MALLPSGKESRLTLRDTLYPLFILYVVSIGFMLQTTVASTSPSLLFAKFVLGILILGAPSLYILRNKSAFRVPILPKRINWLLVTFAVLLGLFFVYAFISVKLIFPAQFPTFLLYYGYFNPGSLLYYPLMISLGAYVLTEELFFRGVIYQYARGRSGIVVGALLTACVFSLAHLNFYIPLLVLLFVLSLVASSLLEMTGVFLYGYIVHATLDIAAFLLTTVGLGGALYKDLYLRTLGFALAAALLGWLLFLSPWSKKLL